MGVDVTGGGGPLRIQGTDSGTYRVVFPIADDVSDPLFFGRLLVQLVPHQEAAVLDVEGDEATLEKETRLCV